jgi:4-carboxymuconolactone decarboxylase
VSGDDLYGALRDRAVAGWDRVMQSPVEGGDAPAGSYPDISLSVLFGDLWQRPHLSVRERRLVVLALLAAYGRTEPMAYHLGGALRSGDLAAADLDELVLQVAFYAGWPAGSTLFGAVRQAVAGHDGPDGHDGRVGPVGHHGPDGD